MIGVGDLAAYLLTAANAIYPQSNHSYMEPKAITQARYEQFAKDIAQVVLDPQVKPIFAGEDGRVKTGLLLVVLARYESSFRNDVMTCTKLGDNGRAFGTYQSHRSPDTVCQGNIQAAWIAIEMIRESFQVCHNFPMSYRLAEYTDGNNLNTSRAFKRSSDRIDTAMNYYSHHNIK